jgi:hypothetical protein
MTPRLLFVRATRASALFAVAAFAAPASAALSTINSNFNGTPIPSPRFIWFNSHLSSINAGGATTPFTIYAKNQVVTFDDGGTTYNITIPDAQVTVNPSGGASTNFDTPSNTWQTAVQNSSNDPFLSGLGWQVPGTGLPGGINPVSWTADFFASTGGISMQWQWSAAVYTTFTTDLNAVGVSPIDGAGGYSQSGTPGNFTDFVTGGARGGGGSNFTGSNSGTASVTLPVIPAPGALALLAIAPIVGRPRRRS